MSWAAQQSLTSPWGPEVLAAKNERRERGSDAVQLAPNGSGPDPSDPMKLGDVLAGGANFRLIPERA